MFVMESVDDLWNHIAYVMAYAPDRFPYRDFLADDEQMNLDGAFMQLRQGVEVATLSQSSRTSGHCCTVSWTGATRNIMRERISRQVTCSTSSKITSSSRNSFSLSNYNAEITMNYGDTNYDDRCENP